MNPPRLQASATACQVSHGASDSRVEVGEAIACLQTTLPVLKGDAREVLLDDAKRVQGDATWNVFEQDDRRAGLAVAPATLGLEDAARRLYDELFEATRGLHLYRIWNYVPHINEHTGGLENYAHFCRGRSLSFEQAFGTNFKSHLPAASAVGSPRGTLAIAFLAGREPATHFENPRQVPAFDYPSQYGPRAPSFARATRVKDQIFISGTAAIRGHETIAPSDLRGQLDCTIENISTIAATTGAGADLGAQDAWSRVFKVYVRRAADFAEVARRLGETVLRDNDHVHYLQADICRSPLLVEIEAILTAAR